MALPQFTMNDLIEAGVHFGHKTRRWNPKMAPYLYGARGDVHIINLQHTFPLLQQALHAVREAVAGNGRILFVGTKRQASDMVAEAATRCGQYYVNQRWLGGMLTNWATIQNSIRKLRQIDDQMSRPQLRLTKKELLMMSRERDKLEKSLGGIKEMAGVPSLIFVIDTNREHLAIAEAARLGIPVIGILDSNSNPENITYPIPGNDDATKAIRLFCNLIADAALDGLQQSMGQNRQNQKGKADQPQLTAEEAFLASEGKDEAPAAEAAPAKGKGKKAAAPAPKKERVAPEVVVKKAPRSKAKADGEDAPAGDEDAA